MGTATTVFDRWGAKPAKVAALPEADRGRLEGLLAGEESRQRLSNDVVDKLNPSELPVLARECMFRMALGHAPHLMRVADLLLAALASPDNAELRTAFEGVYEVLTGESTRPATRATKTACGLPWRFTNPASQKTSRASRPFRASSLATRRRRPCGSRST